MGSCTSKEETTSRNVATTGYRQIITKDMEFTRFIKSDKQDLKMFNCIFDDQLKDCKMSNEDIIGLICEIKKLEEIIKLEEQILSLLNMSENEFIEHNLSDNTYLDKLNKMINSHFKHKQLYNSQNNLINKEMCLKFKKVKLREDKISYDDLILAEIFSEDEISLDLSRQMLSDRKN